MILRLALVLAISAGALACEKKKTSASTATPNIIPSIDVSCGTSSCVRE